MSDTAPLCGYRHDNLPACRGRGNHRCRGRVAHVVAFFSELLVHTKGDYAGKPFVPSKWQRERVLAPLFGEVRYDTKRGRYVRRYRTLYLYIARKNGKSEILAGITLYLLVADGEPGAELYGLALDRDQAGVVYHVAARMIALSPTLGRHLTVVASARRIVDEATGSFYAVIAGDAPGALGLNPHGAYIDELLTQPDRDLYDAIRTGMGTRAQPLLMLATTAETLPKSFAAVEREWSLRVAESPELEPDRLPVIYATDPADDWTSPRVWHQANPALGDFLDLEALASECHKAIGDPTAEHSFRQYRLNQPQSPTTRAIPLETWRDCDPITRDLHRLPCFAGLDLAATQDLASCALVFPDEGGGFDVLWRHYAPSTTLRSLSRRTGGQAEVWAAQGLLTVTEGGIIDYTAIVAGLEADREAYDILEVAFDPWGMPQMQSELLDAGWPFVRFGQGMPQMTGPTRELIRAVMGGMFRHGGNPVAEWEAGNVVTREDSRGGIRFDKEASADKIDGIIAAVMGLDRACRHRDADSSAADYAVAGF